MLVVSFSNLIEKMLSSILVSKVHIFFFQSFKFVDKRLYIFFYSSISKNQIFVDIIDYDFLDVAIMLQHIE